MVVSIVLTLLLVSFQRYVIKKTNSVAIAADHAHYAGDIMMNLSVIASFWIGSYFDFEYADPIFALMISFYLIFSAWRILKTAIVQLSDAELPDTEKQKILKVVLSCPDVSGFHDLKTRAAGAQWFIQLHLELDPDFTLTKAHGVAKEVEKRLRQAFPNADVIIHQDLAKDYEELPDWYMTNP